LSTPAASTGATRETADRQAEPPRLCQLDFGFEHRHGVGMEVLGHQNHHHDLEEVRAFLGYSHIDTTPV
jgi:hypothetical protein